MNEQELHQLQAWRVLKGSIADMTEYQNFIKKWTEYVDGIPNSYPQYEVCAISHVGLYALQELKEVEELNPHDFGTDSFIDEAGDLWWCWFQLFRYYNTKQLAYNFIPVVIYEYFPYQMADWIKTLRRGFMPDYHLIQEAILDLVPRLLHKGWEGEIGGTDVVDYFSHLLNMLFTYISREVVIWMFAETPTLNEEYGWSYDLNFEKDQVGMFFAILTEILDFNLWKLKNRVEEGKLREWNE